MYLEHNVITRDQLDIGVVAVVAIACLGSFLGL